MRRTSIAALVVTLLAGLALVAAGCGGGNKSAAETTATETTAPATTEATPTEATTTEGATTEATKTSGFSGVASAKNCQDLERLGQKFSTAFSGSSNSADLKKQATLFKEFADKAPSDIRVDFQVIAAYFSKIAEVAGNLKSGQTPDAATIAKLQKLSTQIDQTKLRQASQNITAWAQKNCRK